MSRSNCARDREDARDLAVRIAVGVGAAADQIGALLPGLDQQFLGAGIVSQALLREDADLEIDRPGDSRALSRWRRAKLASPMRGSTSTWVRICVVPCRIAFSSVRSRARIDIVLGEVALGGGDLARSPPARCPPRSGSGRGCRTCRDGCGSRQSPAITSRPPTSSTGASDEMAARSRRSGHRRCRCRRGRRCGRRCGHCAR